MNNGDSISIDLPNLCRQTIKDYLLRSVIPISEFENVYKEIGITYDRVRSCFVIVDIDLYMLAKIKYGI